MYYSILATFLPITHKFVVRPDFAWNENLYEILKKYLGAPVLNSNPLDFLKGRKSKIVNREN